MSNFTPQRSVLYVPASNQRAIDKAASIKADWIVFDLEDSVALDDKVRAREALERAFLKREFGQSRVAIRCNAAGTEEFLSDMSSIAACPPDAVLYPKVSTVGQVEIIAKERNAVKSAADIKAWFMIETAAGIANLGDIISKSVELHCRLTTLVVGHNDIASETGVSLDNDRLYMIPWLMQIVLHARQSELQVLDSVWNNFRDLSGFEREALQGRKMGFDGKTLIHPSQVEPATKIFSPTDEELKRARLIVETFAKPENLQVNVLSINGEMIERLHLLQAERLLQKANLA